MITEQFAFASPSSLTDALRALDTEREAAVVVAGGTWVVPNLAHANGTKLVLDLRRLPLRDIVDDGAHIHIGACATYQALSNSTCIVKGAPLLARMAEQITGGPQIRGRGTLGGSACYASPSSDVPACLLALRATFTLACLEGARTVEASAFFKAAYQTDCQPNEILTTITVARLPAGTRFAYHKLKICEGSWPIATAACLLQPTQSGLSVRIGIGGVSPAPLLYEGNLPEHPQDTHIRQAALTAAAIISDEWCDELAGPGYRRAVAPAVIETALRGALNETSV